MHVVNESKKLLSSHFEMNDKGEADAILRVKITENNDGFSLCQSNYIKEVLKKI